jgi:hypothetical protein
MAGPGDRWLEDADAESAVKRRLLPLFQGIYVLVWTKTAPHAQGGTRRVQLVRKEGRDASTLYGREGGGAGRVADRGRGGAARGRKKTGKRVSSGPVGQRAGGARRS